MQPRPRLNAIFAQMLLGLLLAAIVTMWASRVHAAPTRRVLVLNAYHPTYGWTANIVSGIRSVFDPLQDVDLSIEFMDTKKIFTPEYAEGLAKLYSQKFAKIHFDLIISSDDDALNFLLQYRDQLFPGVPAVFCGVNIYREGRLGGHKGFTGVNEENYLDKSLELIALQRPSTKTQTRITSFASNRWSSKTC